MSTYYKSGDWNLICDICSKKIKASVSKHRWDGYITCPECWEPRHSLDFIKVHPDKQYVPFSRPRGSDVFVSVTYPINTLTCTPLGSTSISGFAVAGCSVSGRGLNGLL